MKLSLIIIAFLVPSLAAAGPLEKRLMKAISSCHSMFDDFEESAPNLIKDIKNGYVHIDGDYPTCGCACDATAAAFKTADGSYRVLAYEEWSCDWKYTLSGDDWARVLPADLREEFVPGAKDYKGDALFVVRAKIPRHGTQLELTLGLIPVGIHMTCPSGVCTRQVESTSRTYHAHDSDGDAAAKKVAAAQYPLYQKAKNQKLILKWDRKAGKFSVIKRQAIDKRTLEEFISACGRWEPAC